MFEQYEPETDQVEGYEGYESYEVVDASQPYVVPRKRINLEGRFMPVSADYARALEQDNVRLRAENAQLREALARSGNRYLLADANDWMTRVRKLEMLNASLRAKVRETEAQKRTELHEMEVDHEIEVRELRSRADYYEARYNELADLNSQNVNANRQKRTGRFTSADGMSLEQKQDKALAMFEKNIGYAEIGRVLKISAETAKIYIRKAHDRRSHQEVLERFQTRQKSLDMMG